MSGISLDSQWMLQMMPSLQLEGFRGLPGLLGGEMGGDAFLQLLSQLMAGGEMDFGDVVQQLAGNREEEENGDAMAMMAEMLLSMLSPSQTLNLLDVQHQDTVPTGETAAVSGAESPVQGPDLLSILKFLRETAPRQDVPMKVETDERPVDNQLPLPEILTGEARQTEHPLEAFRFKAAVQEAQALLKSEPKSREPAKEIDIEELQALADMRRPATRTAETQAAETLEVRDTDTQEILQQFRAGILENLGQDKEFVIKLKPEGLGEITVEMVETEGKIALKILASNPQVARALNNDVGALQNSLRPLQAEVQEIAVAPDVLASTQYNFSGQHFADKQQFAWRQPQSNGTAFPGDMAAEGIPGLAAMERSYNAGLDAYV